MELAPYEVFPFFAYKPTFFFFLPWKRAETGLSTVSILIFKLSRLALFDSITFYNLAVCSCTMSLWLVVMRGVRLAFKRACTSFTFSLSFLLAACSLFRRSIAKFKMSFSFGTLRVSLFLKITCMMTFLSFWASSLARSASRPDITSPFGRLMWDLIWMKSSVFSIVG